MVSQLEHSKMQRDIVKLGLLHWWITIVYASLTVICTFLLQEVCQPSSAHSSQQVCNVSVAVSKLGDSMQLIFVKRDLKSLAVLRRRRCVADAATAANHQQQHLTHCHRGRTCNVSFQQNIMLPIVYLDSLSHLFIRSTVDLHPLQCCLPKFKLQYNIITGHCFREAHQVNESYSLQGMWWHFSGCDEHIHNQDQVIKKVTLLITVDKMCLTSQTAEMHWGKVNLL